MDKLPTINYAAELDWQGEYVGFNRTEVKDYGKQCYDHALEDVCHMICSRMDLNIPGDLGVKLLEAVRSLKINE